MPIISTLTLIFGVAAILLVVSTRYSWPAIPFYLLAGLLVTRFVQEEILLGLAQWGIAFLVFAFAVELEPFGQEGLRRDSIVVSVGQFVATGVLVGAVGVLIGLSPLNSLYLALAATLSSSLVALSLLERAVRLRSLHERLAESIHFIEDGIAILVVLALSAFVYSEGTASVLGAGVALIVAGMLFRYFVFERIASFAEGDVEILMLTGISLIIGFVAVAELAGVSVVVGAFAAGLAVSSQYPHDVEMLDAISYLEDFFAPIFFITVGALVAVPGVSRLVIGTILVVAVLVVNPIVTYFILRWRGYDSRTSTLTGYNLDQVSEFSLIIAIEGLAAGVMAPDVFDAIVLAAVVTMFASTVSSRHVEKGYQYLVSSGVLEPDNEDIRARSHVPDDIEGHVVVSGYNREGQQIVEACEEIDHPYVVIESDPTREATVRERCEYYVFGDAKTRSAWIVAGAERAELLVTTDPRREWTEQLLSFGLGVETIVHATDVETGADLLEQGALFVAIPDVLVAERLRDHVTDLLEGETTAEELRERGLQRLDRAHKYGPSDVRRIR